MNTDTHEEIGAPDARKERVALRAVIADAGVQIRVRLDGRVVEDYMAIFDELPAPIVFSTDRGLVLADGFHRLEAASRLDRVWIDVEVREGTWEDAATYAALANAKTGLRLSQEERNAAIRRLVALHPDWSQRRIAKEMGATDSMVRRLIGADRVRDAIKGASIEAHLWLMESHLAAIADAPEEQWMPLVRAANTRRWSVEQATLAVRNLKDDLLPEDFKDRLLTGKVDPLAYGPDGSVFPSTEGSTAFRGQPASEPGEWQPMPIDERMWQGFRKIAEQRQRENSGTSDTFVEVGADRGLWGTPKAIPLGTPMSIVYRDGIDPSKPIGTRSVPLPPCLTVSFPPDAADQIRKVAASEGMEAGQWVRMVVFQRLPREQGGEQDSE